VKEESFIIDQSITRLNLQDITMTSIQPAQTRQRLAATLAAPVPERSFLPSVRSEAEDVQLNQGRIEIQEQGVAAGSS
jgi:hypothetical protein